MSRTAFQFVIGLGLGFLTVSLFHPPGDESSYFRPANFVAAAAATMIAPRFWWTGIVALWIGQTAGYLATSPIDGKWDVASSVLLTFRFVIGDSALQLLLGAVVGAALWYAVDFRRKRAAAQN